MGLRWVASRLQCARMKRIVIIGCAALVLGIAAAGAYWFLMNDSSEAGGDATPATKEEKFAADGIILKDKPGLKKGGWYFEYGSGTPQVIPILFNSASTCAWRETSGLCKPSVFINGRKARIEGVNLEEGIGVTILTFTEPPPAK